MADCEETRNFFTERVESAGGKAQRILCPSPGLAVFSTSGLAPNRALFGQDGRAFAVNGFALVELLADGTLTNRGTVDNDGAPATISSSGDAGGELLLTAGGTRYVYNLAADTLTPVAGGGFIQGGYLDGYFWALDDTSTFSISDLLDGGTWDPLQIAQRNDAADRWIAGLTVGKYIWLFGSETTSVLYDAGTFPFPFALVPGALLPYGIGAVWSAVDVNGSPIWLAQNKSGARLIVQAQGFGVPQRISNHAVERALAGYSRVDDAEAYSYLWQGHWFYRIDFGSANASWEYDLNSGEWSEPSFWNAATSTWEAARAKFHAVAFDRHLVGDRSSGTVYELSATTYTDADGAALRRLRRVPFPRLGETSQWVFLSEFRLLMDVGVGLVSGQGVDPQAMLRISRDGGRTWSNEHWVSMGAMGQYLQRVVWRQLGRFRDGMGAVEVSWSDPVPTRVVDAEFEAA
jgi:hypothetical protein